MATAAFRMPEEFLLKISKLSSKTDEVIPKVLKAGGEIVCEKVRTNLRAVIGKDTKNKSRSTGELLSALGVSSARQDKNGDFNIKIGFSENRTDGKSNAMIANILEYGKTGQLPKPFLKPAISASKKSCIEAMKSKLDEEIGKL